MRPPSRCGSRPSRTHAGLLLACLALLAACGTATRTVPPRTPFATQPTGTPTSTAEVDVERQGMEPAVVTAVRFAGHETYDRVVVDLDGDIPGYNLKWVDEFVQDGSGKRIDVRGGAYLQLTLFPAQAHDEDGEATWQGGPIYPAGLVNLTDVVRTGDFEGRVGIGLVLARQAAFQLRELSTAHQLVLDVAH
jgi:hypothetical protein